MTKVKPNSLVVGYLHPGEVAHSFHESMEAHFVWDATHHQRMVGKIREECGAGRIVDGRNDVVRRFLAIDAEWLGFVDADMGFEPDAWDRLIEAADPVERPIVGGLCFAQRKGPPLPGGARGLQPLPTVFRWVESPATAGVAPIIDYPKDSLIQVDATGAAFFIIHRTVLEKLAEIFPQPRAWFDDTVYKGEVFGEDITFFRRCAENGFPIWVHTGVQISHYKPIYLTEQTVSYAAPTYVVIPVKDRLDLTSSLLRQLHAQGGYEEIYVFDNGSGKRTKNWLASQSIARVFDAEGLNIHQMWNRGIEEAAQKAWPFNVAILNNDLKIGPNFLQGLADALRSQSSLGAVSPNYDGRDGTGLQDVRDICAGRYDGTGGLAGFAFMMKGESGYRFPEALHWWFGDNDLMANILASGSRAAIALDVTVEHVDGGSQTGDWTAPEIQEQLAADHAFFVEKWGPKLTWGTCTADGRQMRFSPPDRDRWIVEENAPSIAVGYNRILDQAQGPVVLVHDDVTLSAGSRMAILQAFADGADIVGQVGAHGFHGLPWWDGQKVGRVDETRGFLDFGPAAEKVDQIDGFLIALAPHVAEVFRFDESYEGWHGYDADLSATARLQGWRIDVADIGASHHTKGGYGDKESWDQAQARWTEKWAERMSQMVWHQPIAWPPPDLGSHGEDIFRDIVARLDGIPYVVGFGTALGLHRDGRLIETDTDIDLCILPAQEQDVREAFAGLPLAGTRLQNGMVRQLVYYPEGVIVDVDIFLPTGDGYAYEQYRLGASGFDPDWRDTPYGKVPLPGDIEAWLEELYGDWRTPKHRAKP